MCVYLWACINAGGVTSLWVQPGTAALAVTRCVVILARSAAVEFIMIHDCCDHDLEKQVSVLLL